MQKKINCDIAILGAGPAGYTAALRAAELGANVVLIEKKDLGGVCLNDGCIPTKALLKTAEIASEHDRAKEFGIESHIDNMNWNAAVNRKNRVVKSLNIGLDQLLKSKEITIIKGWGTVTSSRSLLVETEEGPVVVNCDKMIITTGAVPMIPPIKGIDTEGVITSSEALMMEKLPSSLVIIGAGAIGLEFASIMNPLGVKVTVIELQDRILPEEDREIAEELFKILKREGISIKLSAEVLEIQKTQEDLEILYAVGNKQFTTKCEKILIAAGRKLNTDLLQSIPLNLSNNAIVVGENMETNIEGVYAAGDVVGGRLLAHLAFREGTVAAENALGMNTKINYQAIPSCVYTNPEVAAVGMTEEKATEAGIAVKVGRSNFRDNGRALTLGEREGFVKVITDQSGTIIGGQIMGFYASEIISELTLAITLGAKAEDLATMIHPHPALSEAIWQACGDLVKVDL